MSTLRLQTSSRSFSLSFSFGPRWVALFVLVLAAMGEGGQAVAQPPINGDISRQSQPWRQPLSSRPDGEQILRFRRVFVPTARQADVTSGYLPLRRDKFEELLDNVRRKQSAEQSQVHLVRARYFALLQQQTLGGGFAELDFHNPSSTPLSTPLRPLGIAAGSAVWELPNRTPAEFGSDGEGNSWVVVPQTGRLFLPWSLRGEVDDQHVISFRLRLPSCPRNQLILALPRNMVPHVEEGMVSRWNGHRGNWENIPEAKAFADADPEHFDFWQLDLGGNSETTLRVSPGAGEEPVAAFVTLRQSDQLTCYASRVEWQAELTLDVYRAATEGLAIRLGDQVSLLDARLGEESVPWIVDHLPEENSRRYQLQFPRALQGPGHALRLTIHSPLLVDQPWKLPGLRCEDVFWQEGRAELIFPDGLELERLVPESCVQTKVNTLPQGATSLSFQCYRPDYALGVTWRHREARLTAEMGTSIRLDSELISGEAVVDFLATWGEAFVVRAQVPRPWEIDRVEVEPASALASGSGAWRFEQGILEIPLREPITAEQPLRVRVEGHRAAPPEATGLRVEQLQFLQFPDVSRPDSIVRVHPASPLQVKLTDDADLPRIDPRTLAPDELQRLGEGSEGIFFRRELAPSTLTAMIAQESPSFVVDSRVDVILDGPRLTEAYVIRCIPESLPVRRVRVQLSQARDPAVVWNLSGFDEPLTASRVTQGSPNGRGELTGESWDIELPRPQSSVFELQGERSLEITEPTPVALASMPQATSETGRVTVRAREPVRISSRGLEPLPMEPPRVDQYPLIRGVFRYQPSHTDQLVVGGDDASAWPRTWVWATHYTSRLVGQDEVVHDVLFRLQNTGAESVEALLPAGVMSLVIHVDQRRIADISDQGRLTLPLPSSRRFPTIRMRYRTSAVATLGGARLAVPFPKLEVPTMTARWSLLTDTHDQVRGPDQAIRLTPLEVTSVPRRLFGTLARSTPTTSQGTRHSLDGPRASASDRLRNDIPDRGGSIWGDLDWGWGRGGGRAEANIRWSDLGEQPNWRTLLDTIERQISDTTGIAGLELRVDQYALGLVGILPRNVPPHEQGNRAHLMSVAELLDEYELLLMRAGEVWVLTTREMETLYRGQLDDTEFTSNVFGAVGVSPEGWFHRLLLDRESDVCGFPTILAWENENESFVHPWEQGRGFEASLPHVRRGKTLHAFELDPTDLHSAEVQVTRGTYLGQGAWLIFLVVMAGGMWLAVSARRWLAWYAVGASVVALLVPEIYVAWGAAGFWAALLSWIHGAIRPVTVREPSDLGEIPANRWRLGWGIAMLGAVWWAQPLFAQDDDQETRLPPPASGEFRVLIPVDQDKQTVGAYVYVPRNFYDFIYRYLDSEDEPYDWLLRKATYTGQYNATMGTNGTGIASLSAQYQFETFQPHQWIRLPLKRRELQLIDVKLNGQPAEVRWSSDEDELLIMAVQPRLHELSLIVGPRRVELGNALNFAVPAIPNATMIVRDLPASVRLEPVGALGSVRSEDGRLEVHLGPVSRVTLRRADARVRMDAASVEVEELAWLRVRPGATVLDVRLQVSSQGGRIDSLSLLADSRLRLLPLGSGQPVEGEPVIVEGDYQQIRLKLRETLGSRFSLQLSFLFTNTSGVGQLRLPRWEVSGAKRTRRWLAVSHAPTIGLHDVEAPTLPPMEPDQFLSAWGRDVEIPHHTYEFPADEPIGDRQWKAESRFLPSETSVNQQTRIRVTRDAVHLDWDALLTTTGSPAFQRRLRVPPQFELDELVIMEGDTEQTPRYRLNAIGDLTVFLPSPAEARQRMLLKGHLPSRQRSVIELPLVHLSDARNEVDLLELYRGADVEMVTLQHVDSWIAQTPVDQGEPSSSQYHWLGTWSRPGDAPGEDTPTLVVRPNQRSAEGHLATRLLRSSEGWRVEAEYHLQVEQGVYDMVRLELPSDWMSPLELDPPHPFELRPLPGENRQQLIIRPPEPIRDRYSVRLRGNWATMGDRIRRVPDILPLDVVRSHRFLVVPTRLEAQQISWATSGLQAGPLPELFQLSREKTDAWESYHVLGARFHANIRHVERVAGFPQIRLADIHIRWQPFGYQGLAMFEIEPAGRRSCLIHVPPGIELLVASLDGVSAGLEPVDERRWKVTLGVRQLPQRLELLFQGQPETGGGVATRLRTPFCDDFPVARTLWTIRAPASRSFSWTDSGESRVTDARQELVRLESLAAMVDLAHDAAAELGAEDAESWWKRWAPRVAISRAKIRRHRLNQPLGGQDGFDERMQAIEESWRAETRQFGHIAMSQLLSEDPREVWELRLAWGDSTRGLHQDFRFMFPGTADSLTLQAAAETRGSWAWRWGLVLTLTVGMALVWFAPRPPRLDWGCEHPQLVLMLIGIVALIWITPPWIGVACMLLALVSAWRFPWRSAPA